eukprot:Phypoly_transcript_07762.p1 GENE.Phypoly_transcript_07762~~Phypoly_transcript_07762.p1  ORF type:complete len:510 (+),score=75.11 Phypoly_transcript_07762:77-1531(+)
MRASFAGPRDNNNYRANTEQRKRIPPSAITYEGILNEYCFSDKEEPELLFNTFFSSAISKNPETGEKEHFLSLQMMSKLDGDGLERHGGRPPMNFAFILDVSGSMGASFAGDSGSKTKMDVAKECLVNLISRLSPKDRFGLIIFNTLPTTLVQLSLVESLDLSVVKQQILEIKQGGGTDLQAGLEAGRKMLVKFTDDHEPSNNTNRMMFLTDLDPNGSEQKQLIEFAHETAKKRLFTTVIGIGLNFNVDLNYQLSKVKGCNSFGVLSSAQFRKQMITDFNHTSLLIAYDISVKMQSSQFEVEEIYGSPLEPNKAIGEVLKLDSICPSAKSDEGIKGGMVLLKLKRKEPKSTCGDKIALKLRYYDWNDAIFKRNSTLDFPEDPDMADYYEDPAIRKAIALVRYVKTVKRVLEQPEESTNKETLEKCKSYILSEMEATGDRTLDKEILMLDTHIGNLEQDVLDKEAEAARKILNPMNPRAARMMRM